MPVGRTTVVSQITVFEMGVSFTVNFSTSEESEQQFNSSSSCHDDESRRRNFYAHCEPLAALGGPDHGDNNRREGYCGCVARRPR